MPIKDLLFGFDGRIRRSQWWAAQLAVLGVVVALISAAAVLLGVLGPHADSSKVVMGGVFGLALIALIPFMLWINASLGVKRLHDQDLSGWFALLFLIPWLGGLISFVMLGCLDGTQGANRYGPSPKSPERKAGAFG